MSKILVADDNPLSLRFFADALTSLGHDVVLAGSGREAESAAAREAFDLLLLDARMPDGSGEEALARIRARVGPSNAAVAVATTADPTPDTEAALRAHGFAAVLSKPITVDELRAALACHLPDAMPWLDDAHALRATADDPAIVAALRGLFAGELQALPDELKRLSSEPSALAERLHRLQASAGFCGAQRLLCAIAAARRHPDSETLTALLAAAEGTLRAIADGVIDVMQGAPSAKH